MTIKAGQLLHDAEMHAMMKAQFIPAIPNGESCVTWWGQAVWGAETQEMWMMQTVDADDIFLVARPLLDLDICEVAWCLV